MVKLDLKDKKLLCVLNNNSRLTSKELGKYVGISREVADYRVKKLISSKIITKNITLVDTYKLGYTSYLFSLSLQDYSLARETEILNKLVEHKWIKWVAKCMGDWDIQFVFACSDKKHLQNLIFQFNEILGDNLYNYEISVSIDFWKSKDLQFLLDFDPIKRTNLKSTSNFKLNVKDVEILYNLSKSSNISLVTLSKNTGFAIETIKNRKKILEHERIILRYESVVDITKLDYYSHYLFLSFKSFSQQIASRLKTFFEQVPEVGFVENIVGKWDIRVQITCKTSDEFKTILNKIREEYTKDLRYYNSCILLQELKRVSFTQGMYEDLKQTLSQTQSK